MLNQIHFCFRLSGELNPNFYEPEGEENNLLTLQAFAQISHDAFASYTHTRLNGPMGFRVTRVTSNKTAFQLNGCISLNFPLRSTFNLP